MSRSESFLLLLLGLDIVRTSVAIPTNHLLLNQHTHHTDADQPTRNSQNDSLLIPSPPTAYIEGGKSTNPVMLTAGEGEAEADQGGNTSHSNDAEEVREEGDLSLYEMREILKKEQQLIRKKRSPRGAHRRHRHGRRGRGSKESRRWGRRGGKHSKGHRGRRKGNKEWRKRNSKESKSKWFYKWKSWGHKHSSSSSSEEGDAWLTPLWTTFPRRTTTLPTPATSKPTPPRRTTTTLPTPATSRPTTSPVTSTVPTSLTTHTQTASPTTKPTIITTTPDPPITTPTTPTTSSRPTASTTSLVTTASPTVTMTSERASTSSSPALTSGYTFPNGRPLTLEPEAETLRPLV